MKKIILMIVSLLPFANVSVAALIKLNDLAREEKIILILEAMEMTDANTNINEMKNEDLDAAIDILLKNGVLLESTKVKKGTGGESAGGGFGG